MKDKKVTIMIIAVAVLAIAALLIATSGQKDKSSVTISSTDSSTAKSQTTTKDAVAATAVTIDNYDFGPKVIKVKVGDTVTWTNNDSVKHSIVADQASDTAPNGDLFGKGETYKFTFTKAGTYNYHCMPHPYMKGTVIVE